MNRPFKGVGGPVGIAYTRAMHILTVLYTETDIQYTIYAYTVQYSYTAENIPSYVRPALYGTVYIFMSYRYVVVS
jgi:hypothetical protein